jgi:putative zinc finger/helix-turn-helix YgiT family protein
MDNHPMSEPDSAITGGKLLCPDCGSSKIETSEENHSFTYGHAEDKADLIVKVPVRACSDCGASFLDRVAEDLCHDAVCQHLGVMTPSQIKGLRKLYNLTQAQFRDITKLGEATLSRWERGLVIQNQAYDNYLYLLGFPENLDKIRSRDKSGEVSPLSVDNGQDPEHRQGIMLRNIPPGSPTFRCGNPAA